MKSKKCLVLSLLLVLMLTLVIGCTGKKELTAKEFKTLMEEEKFTVVDSTENYTQLSNVKKVLIATSTLSSYKIEYYQFKNNKKSKELFDKLESTFENKKSKKNVQYQTTSLGNYNYYSLTTVDSYKIVSRIGKTVIVTDSDRRNKESIKEIINKLGY